MNPVVQKYHVLSTEDSLGFVHTKDTVHLNFGWLGNLLYSFDGSSAVQINQIFSHVMINSHFGRVQLKTVNRC